MDRIYVMQLARSFQVGQINRRTFLARATAALGSAAAADLLLAACQPAQPQSLPPVLEEGSTQKAPMPSADDLITDLVAYPDPDGETLMGYLARPEGDQPHAGVIVIQEWWGVDNHIQDLANRFAHEGFVALAPDLYHGKIATEPNEARKLVMQLDMAEAVREIQHAMSFLLAQEYVAGDKVGVVGFCMGGGLTLNTALTSEDVGAAVVFYGQPLKREQAANVQAPILGFYGSADQGIPLPAVRIMADALTESDIQNEIHVYEGAQHAFFNDTRQSYNDEAATDAWSKTLAWFREHLAG